MFISSLAAVLSVMIAWLQSRFISYKLVHSAVFMCMIAQLLVFSNCCARYGLFCSAELEWKLSQIGAIKTELTKDPRKKNQIQDIMTISVRGRHRDPDDSDESD